MTEVGKLGKELGQLRPSSRRRIDPVPERSTPKAKPKKTNLSKRFGVRVEWRWGDRTGSVIHVSGYNQWYASANKRDQALAAARKQHAHRGDRVQVTAVER